MEEEFIPQNIGTQDCTDKQTWGQKSVRYDYIVKSITSDEDYPADACPPWIHGNAQIDNLKINGTATGNFQGTINVQSWKGFDIQHPSKEGHRLRYVCLEGPEGGVYTRGRVKNKTEIDLPDYWKDLVDIQSITVNLTPVGAHQDVIVKRWDEDKIYLQAKGGMPIDCFYHIFAERKDGEKLIVEYEGESPADYPGDSSQYSIAGYDYGRKNETLDISKDLC